MLKIYNSLTRRKEVFTPIEPGKVGMYVCGVTVYDFSHIGHARMFFVFDMVLRHLRELGYDVTYVRNITDIDDKIIRRAAENAEPVEALTERFIDAFHEDCDTLGLLPPTHEPRATGHIDDIVTMIAQLIENGLAYAADNGDVYYRVNAFEGYGKLSGRQLADLRSGARVEVDEAKEDPLDFVLWKAAKPGEPAWESPWGSGRPGWHIECSAMSTAMLGNTFDIHGGGMDLKFPHHENEIAQSCGATGEDFVKMWIHNGFVEVNAEKMSKSLGNFFTIREVLERYYADEIRYFMLTSQYRSPLNYSDQDLDAARAGLTRLYTALRGLEPGELPASEPYSERFRVAMNDDFNTPEAVAVLFDIAREINRLKGGGDTAAAASLGALLVELGGKLAVLEHPAEQWLKRPQLGADAGEGLSDADIAALVEQRTEARVSKDWALSDKIRDQLAAQGVVLEDGAGTTTWRRGN